MKRFTPSLVDSLLALGLFILGLEGRSDVDLLVEGFYTRQSDIWNILLIALQSLPIAWRRRFPRVVLALVLGSFTIDRMADYPNTVAAIGGLVLAFHAIGSELKPKQSMRIGYGLAAFVTVFTVLGATQLESVDMAAVITTGLLVSVPVFLGREVYQRRAKVRELEDRATAAEADREQRAAEAIAEERSRIARELHDVVAHQMVVITLQAEGARRLAGDSSPQVAEALDTIRRTGRDALEEMRSMVGLLRTASEESQVELTPQPGLGAIDRLVAQMNESGLNVDLVRSGTSRDLPGGLDLHAYRIIQESLTNTLKHAGPGTAASVVITYSDETLDLEITDNGETARSDNGAGHGLVGMRERVALLNGELTAAPTGRGFRVHATIPVHR
jgi:signal transduction histidine kinase